MKIAPVHKVTAATLGAAIGDILVGTIQEAGYALTESVEGAIVVLCVAIAGWLMPENTGPQEFSDQDQGQEPAHAEYTITSDYYAEPGTQEAERAGAHSGPGDQSYP